MAKILEWKMDPSTAIAANSFPILPRGVKQAEQFQGKRIHCDNWGHRVLDTDPWPAGQVFSHPENIIDRFADKKYLQGLALVVSWGTMTRQAGKIWGPRKLEDIEVALDKCAISIVSDNSVEAAWELLTRHGAGGLGWSKVITSKTLHFLARSLGFSQNPPVAIDGEVIIDRVWWAFIYRIAKEQRPDGWDYSSYGAYCRYMTAILTWAEQEGWSTTEVEATIFDCFSN